MRQPMSRIQSSTGLITGIPIEDTVNKLMALAAQPKNILTNRTKDLQNQKLAVTQLTSLLVALSLRPSSSERTACSNARQATSSNRHALRPRLPPTALRRLGNYLFTPVQTASAQQLLSQSFAADADVGAGSFTFGTGGFVDQGNIARPVEQRRRRAARKNSHHGSQRRDAVIDLSFARTVDDVLDAINDNSSINVTAVAVGDSFKLTDNSGGIGNLKVQEVGGGIDGGRLGAWPVSTSRRRLGDGYRRVSRCTRNSDLRFLNDGNGVQLRNGNDLCIRWRTVRRSTSTWAPPRRSAT